MGAAVTGHLRADPTKLAEFAGAVLDASKGLRAGEKAFAGAPRPPVAAFGNLSWYPDLSSALATSADGGQAAAAALSASLTREVDGLYQTAFFYQETEKKHRGLFKSILDDLNPFG